MSWSDGYVDVAYKEQFCGIFISGGIMVGRRICLHLTEVLLPLQVEFYSCCGCSFVATAVLLLELVMRDKGEMRMLACVWGNIVNLQQQQHMLMELASGLFHNSTTKNKTSSSCPAQHALNH